MIGWLVNNELERIWNESVMALFSYTHDTYIKRLSKSSKILSQDSQEPRCPVRDLNRSLPGCKSKTATRIYLLRTVCGTWKHNINIDLRLTENTDLDWIKLADNSVQCRDFWGHSKDSSCSIKTGTVLTSWVTLEYSVNTLLHGGLFS
jgi:hypothetical protein